MKPDKHINLNKAIIFTKVLDNSDLLVIDENTAIRFIDIDKLTTKSGFKTNLRHERYSSNMVFTSDDAKYFVSTSSDTRVTKLYDTNTKKALAKVDRHQGEVSCVGIDPKGRYMLSGGDDGKTFVINIKSRKLMLTLPGHADTINDIAFSSNGQFVATASYDKQISVFNLAMLTSKARLKAHSAAVMKLLFLSNHRLFSIDKNNGAIIWDINTGKVITRLSGIHDDVTQVVSSDDDKFLFLGTKLGYILVYELEKYQLVEGRYIKLKDSITSLSFYAAQHQLIVGTKNGDLLLYNIYEGQQYLINLLKEKKYPEVQHYVKNNPLLEYTKAYQMLEVLWSKTVEKAKEYLGNGDKNRALALFENFKNISSKNQLVQKLMKEYLEFDKFALLVKQNKLALAYGLTVTYPAYKDSKLYESMEAEWKKTFATAQKYLLDPGSSDKAKEILAPYRGITEKTKHIHELLTNIEISKMFRAYIAKKDFKMALNLIDKNPFLVETSEYTSMMDYADNVYIKSHEFIQSGDTHSAVKLLKILENFPDYQAEVIEFLEDAQNRQKFFDAIESDNMVDAYNLLSISEYLQNLDDGSKLIALWDDDTEIANSYAVKGDVNGVEKVLEKYMKISSKYMPIAIIFSLCYITQLETAIKQKKDRLAIEKGIKNYLSYFGLQEQITHYFDIFKRYYPDTNLDLELQNKGSLSMWKPTMIVKSILD